MQNLLFLGNSSRRFSVIFILFCTQILFAQFQIIHYNSENGLPHDLCYQIIQDKQGYIWLGTDNGLVKFNGNVFQIFNRNHGLNNSFVIDVYEQGDKKYIATWGGGCYVLEKNRFKSISDKKHKFSKQQQIIVNAKGEIYTVENKLRLNSIKTEKSKRYLSLYANKEKKKWLNANYVNYAIDIKRKSIPLNLQLSKIDSSIYCFTERFSPQFKGIYKINTSNPEIVFPFLNDYYIIEFYKKENHFIAVTPNAILTCSNEKIIRKEMLGYKNKSIIHYTENSEFKAYILLDKKTNSNELLIIDKRTNQKTLYSHTILKSPVSDLLISFDNTIWVSTYGNGLLTFRKPIIPLSKNILKENYLFDYIEEPTHNFFLTTDNIIATDKNYNFKAKEKFKSCAYFVGKINDTIGLINTDKTIYTVSFLSSIFKSHFKNLKYQWNGYKIEYGDNIFFYFRNNKWEKLNFKLTNDEYNFLKIKKLVTFQNKLFIVTNYGLYVVNKLFKLEKFINKSNGLINDEIINAFEKQGKLYMLQYQSVAIFDGEYITNYRYLNAQNNFFNNFTITKDGAIWIASQKGLVQFTNGNYNLYTKLEGLSSSFYAKIYENQNKELVALGNNGLDIIKVAELSKSHQMKTILSSNEIPLISDKSIVFEPNTSAIIKVDVINYLKSKYHLQYQINSQKWQNLNGNTIDFSNYSAGRYQLKIRYRYNFSHWVTTPTYRIDKIAVWYLRWYFYVPLLVTLIVGISYLVYRRVQTLKLRNQRLQNLLDSNEKLQFQLNEMRHNIAQDFHDELGNKLAGISVLSDKLLHDEKLKTNENYPVVERIYKDSQDLFQGIRDFIWAIDSKHSTLEELVFALTDFGEELFSHSNIKFLVNNLVNEADFLLPNFWNRQLLLLFKEAMTNAFKHSQASQLDLIFKMENEVLIIECKDNGVGFQKEKLQRQNGLFNLQKRANKLKSELIIISDSGTIIIFKGKLT